MVLGAIQKMDEINRRNAIKLATTTGVGSALLSTWSSRKVAAATPTGSNPEQEYPESIDGSISTGNITEPVVSQGSSLGWFTPRTPEDSSKDYWEHEFSITSTSAGWYRNTYDGTRDRQASILSDMHWELDMSGTFSTQSNGGGEFVHFPMSHDKYAGFYPHPDPKNETFDQIIELLIDSAVAALNPAIGGALAAADLIEIMVPDASQGLTNLSEGYKFDNTPDGSFKKMHCSHRVYMEVPFDVDDSDEVKITVWTGGRVGVETTYTLAFTENGDDVPTQTTQSGETFTLDPEKMTPEQRERFGVERVSESDTALSVGQGDTTSTSGDSVGYIATNLPLQVESVSRKIESDQPKE